jgi:hypothetical protein
MENKFDFIVDLILLVAGVFLLLKGLFNLDAISLGLSSLVFLILIADTISVKLTELQKRISYLEVKLLKHKVR